MSKKARKKAYNPMRRAVRLADYTAKDKLLVYVSTETGWVLYDRRRNYLIKPTESQTRFAEFPMQWAIYLAAFGRTQLGQDYMKSDSFVTQARYKQDDLIPHVAAEHAKVIASIPEDQFVGIGWIASPEGIDLTEQEAGRIFENMKAWDVPAKWQDQTNQDQQKLTVALTAAAQ